MAALPDVFSQIASTVPGYCCHCWYCQNYQNGKDCCHIVVKIVVKIIVKFVVKIVGQDYCQDFSKNCQNCQNCIASIASILDIFCLQPIWNIIIIQNELILICRPPSWAICKNCESILQARVNIIHISWSRATVQSW